MKKLVLMIALVAAVFSSQAQLNMTFRSKLTYSGALSNVGGIAVNGHEYALVGWEQGLSIVDVTNPDSIYERYNVPGPTSIWREVKTFGNYVYVTTEGSGGQFEGLTIVNLGDLPATINSTYHHTYKGDGAIANQIVTIHALHIDEGYVYLYGTNLFNGAALICNLNIDPWNPVYVGNTSGADPNYIHDGYVRNDTLYACHIYTPGYLSIMDVTDKANPVELNTQSTPDQFTHNSWLNDEGTVVFTTDEVDDSFLAAYDISDPFNIQFLDQFQTAPGSQAIVHNTHTLNNYEVVSWYKEGVVVVDVARPDNLIEVGHYDTSPLSGGGFDGAWGVYPYLPSGNLLITDISEGLFVVSPAYVRACYLEGLVTDSVTTLPINGALVTIVSSVFIEKTNLAGIYKTGIATAGLYDVTVTKQGYLSKTIYGVQLTNGVVTNLNVELFPLVMISITGNVTNALTGAVIPNAVVSLKGSNGTFNANADVAGNFTVSGFYPGTYDVSCGKWGFIEYCSSGIIVNAGGSINLQLMPGYYDDFSVNLGWITGAAASTTSGIWVREVPIETIGNNNTIANPGVDNATDCGEISFVTGNGGGNAGNDDVDGGWVTLTSPVFDLTGYVNPKVYYSRWFFNQQSGGNSPNDSLTVYITNGTQTVLIDNVGYNPNTIGQWIDVNKTLNTYITSSATMKLIVRVEDKTPGNVTEGAFDKFQIVDGTLSLNEIDLASNTIQSFPNPFNNTTDVAYHFNKVNASSKVVVTDVIGQTVATYTVTATTGKTEIGQDFNAGVYFIQLKDDTAVYQTLKVVKTK